MLLPVPAVRALDTAVGERTDGHILLRLDCLPLGPAGLTEQSKARTLAWTPRTVVLTAEDRKQLGAVASFRVS